MTTTISGIDIYRYQEGVDWQKVRDIRELRFVYAKVTQGVDWTDPLFESHRDGAINVAGKDFGAIHFLDYFKYQRGKEIQFGRQQAEFMWPKIEKNPGQAPFVSDCEKNEDASWGPFDVLNIGRILKINLAFHVRMKELSGRFGGDYCPMWVTAHMKNFTEGFYFGPRYKVVSVYNPATKKNETVQPVIDHFLTWEELQSYAKPTPSSYPDWTLFQYASTLKGSVIGTKAVSIDADIFNGGEEKYSAWLGQTCVPTSPVITEDDIPDVVNEITKRMARVISSVNVRSGVGTISAQYLLGASKPFVLLNGEKMPIYESTADSAGNPWHRIGYKEWVCERYNGTPLLEIIQEQ